MNDEPVKIIHYCWFGPRKLSKVAKKCIKTWKKFLPDYEIKLWTVLDKLMKIKSGLL